MEAINRFHAVFCITMNEDEHRANLDAAYWFSALQRFLVAVQRALLVNDVK